ncbi:HigA family addiction module antitoxin [Massilia sp. Root418]|uniref:HigA family addiction module antitoxin n=1 Tax=Massilia sp. Root418 TaxID=1736532 RepID=UPI0009E73241|nr:HigA family addiction module antitoxin [Massilia sp. Root418]
MPLHNPPHPGSVLLRDVLPALDMTCTEFARRLGIARETLSRIMHGRAPISPDLAVRLERAGISTARMWLAVQAEYDLWHAARKPQPPIKKFAAFP